MKKILKNISSISDSFFLFSFSTYIFIFYFDFKTEIFSKFIIIIGCIALIVRLYYFLLIFISKEIKNNENKSKKVYFYMVYCILLYITPIYYILQYSSLVISKFIILITLFLISLLSLISIVIEKKIIKINSDLFIHYENN